LPDDLSHFLCGHTHILGDTLDFHVITWSLWRYVRRGP